MNKELIKTLKKLMQFRPKTITVKTVNFEYIVKGDDLVFIYPFLIIYSSDCYFTDITRRQTSSASGVLNINDIDEINIEF